MIYDAQFAMGAMVLVPSPVATPNIPSSCNMNVQDNLTQFLQR